MLYDAFYTVNRWLSIRLNLFSAVIVGLAAFVTIFTPTIDAALAGFILAFASTVTTDVSVVYFVIIDDALISFADFIHGNVVFMTCLSDPDRFAIGSAVR